MGDFPGPTTFHLGDSRMKYILGALAIIVFLGTTGCDNQVAPAVTPVPEPEITQEAPASSAPGQDVDALAIWDDNGNGRISCAEARAHGIAPVRREHPAYQYMRDSDDDGVVCE